MQSLFILCKSFLIYIVDINTEIYAKNKAFIENAIRLAFTSIFLD